VKPGHLQLPSRLNTPRSNIPEHPQPLWRRTGADSPVGRVDILFHRLAEVTAKKLEQRFSMPGIWESFVKPIADEKAQEFEGMGPVEFARHIGFLKTGRKRRRIA
jgi:hypothetical protein